MFFITSKLLAFISKPIFWLFSLLISSIISKKNRKKILYITLFVFYFFTNHFIVDKISGSWQTSPKPISSITNYYKYGIVLGGYSSYNNAIKHINLNERGDRLISAIELYKLNRIEKIIISGGNGKLINDGMKESEWSRELLINMGVEKKDIILESNSRNTMQNAQYTAELIQDELSNKSLLITSANHMKRALFCFKKNNINIDTYPTDYINTDVALSFDYLFIPNVEALTKWERLIHEWVGYIAYKIRF